MADPKDSETIFDEKEEPEKEGSNSEEEVPEQSVEGEGEKEEAEEEKEQSFLDGTTFKSGNELAKAYKELQASFTRRNQEFSDMQGLLKQVIPLLTARQRQEVKEDPDAFMKAFVTDPRGTLLKLISEAHQSKVEPLQGEVRQLSASVELNSFLSNHPELEEQDVEAFLKVMDAYPEVRSRKDRLEVWFRLFKDENPEFRDRAAQRKESLEQGASDAKKAAALGGRKSSAPKNTEGDPFDDLLSLSKERNAYFNDRG